MEYEREPTNLKTFAISLSKLAVFGSISFVLVWYCFTVFTSDSATFLQWLGVVLCLPVLFYTVVKSGFAFVLAVIDLIIFFLRFAEFVLRKRG